jgi:NADH-quinone oxidoreductase subunit N
VSPVGTALMFRDEGILLAAVAAGFIWDVLRPRGSRCRSGWIVLAGAVGALAAALASPVPEGSLWGGVFLVDPLSRFAKAVFLAGLALACLVAHADMEGKRGEGEYHLFLGASTLGMMLLASAGDLLSLFVALELTGISLYAASAVYRGDARSQEAGLKYLLVGAFSSGIFLYGASMLYGVGGTTRLAGLAAEVAGRAADPMALAGMVLVVAGIAYKVGAVPFHAWAPDVYEGAPPHAAAFASTASKAAGFIVLARLLMATMGFMKQDWSLVLAVMAVASMVLGSFAAIPQANVRRVLAYSSIAQAGYILVGFVPGTERGMSSVLFYLPVYLFMNFGAFACAAAVRSRTGSDDLAGWNGLAKRSPLLALAMTLSLLSLAGIPPLGGFAGKVYLFSAAMEGGGRWLWLVVTGVLLSIVSLYYYLLVIRRMYMAEPDEGSVAQAGTIRPGVAASLAIMACVAGIIVTGILPSWVLGAAIETARRLLGVAPVPN